MVSVISILLDAGDPEEGIWGIYTAVPRQTAEHRFTPCSSRFFLKKASIVDGEDLSEKKLLSNICWQDFSEVKRETGLSAFSNKINDHNVLEAAF